MTLNDAPSSTFAYRAQTPEGAPISGTIEAADADEARWRLAALSLRVVEMEPVDRPVKPKAVRGEDFAAFNEQLASLTAAGLPIERGLRLIASDMRSRRMAEAVRQVAEELERGRDLGDAFAAHADQFPPLYGKLIEAGVRSGNLPAMLLNLGRHMQMVQRLRASVWRAAAYPIAVLGGMACVLVFLSYFVVPQMYGIFADFDTQLPLLTRIVFQVAERAPQVLAIVAAVIVVIYLLSLWARRSGRSGAFTDLVLAVPLLGPVLRRNLVARWCDALALGVDAGLPLPAAVDLASQAVGSPAVSEDARGLMVAHEVGQPLHEVGARRVLSDPVVVALDLGSQRHDLGGLMRTLRDMYEQQAAHRLSVLNAVLAPLLLLFVAGILGNVIAAIFLPLIRLIQSVSGG